MVGKFFLQKYGSILRHSELFFPILQAFTDSLEFLYSSHNFLKVFPNEFNNTSVFLILSSIVDEKNSFFFSISSVPIRTRILGIPVILETFSRARAHRGSGDSDVVCRRSLTAVGDKITRRHLHHGCDVFGRKTVDDFNVATRVISTPLPRPVPAMLSIARPEASRKSNQELGYWDSHSNTCLFHTPKVYFFLRCESRCQTSF